MSCWFSNTPSTDNVIYEFRMTLEIDSMGEVAKSRLFYRRSIFENDQKISGPEIQISVSYETNHLTPDVVYIRYNKTTIPYVLRAYMRQAGLYRTEESELVYFNNEQVEKIYLKPDFYKTQLECAKNENL